MKMLHCWLWRQRDCESQECSWTLEAEKGEETDLPLEPPKRTLCSAGTSTLPQRDPHWMSDLHKLKDKCLLF